MEKQSQSKSLTRPIEILLIVRWPVGGIRTFLRYVYRHFDKSSYKLTIIAPDVEEMQILMTDLADTAIEYVPIKNMPIDGSTGFGLMFKSVVKQLFRKHFDVVHSHGFTSAMSADLPVCFFRIPHILTSHDILNRKQFAGIKGLLKKIGLCSLLWRIDCIHCVSIDAMNNLLAHIPILRKKHKKIITIPNGIEVSRFLIDDREDFTNIDGVKKEDFLIGFFGRFMAQKGFRYLVDAIEILSKQDLPRPIRVLCFGWGGFVREEQVMLLNRGLLDYFVFLPFRDNVARAIRGVNVVVMPSLWEACPILPMETMVAGVPLIGSDCIGLREVLQGSAARMVPTGDAGALAEAIANEMAESTLERSLAYRNEASLRFDVINQANQLKNIINKLYMNDNFI
jgi:glycosyltransferase involved in cell wall biosynthesis